MFGVDPLTAPLPWIVGLQVLTRNDHRTTSGSRSQSCRTDLGFRYGLGLTLPAQPPKTPTTTDPLQDHRTWFVQRTDGSEADQFKPSTVRMAVSTPHCSSVLR